MALHPIFNLPRNFDQLGARLDNAALLAAAGVRVMFLADESQNQRQLRQLAGNAVAHGMSWAQALRAVTANAAEVFALPDGVGSLREGARANLVIWNGDPFELSSWPTHVMLDGEWLPLTSPADEACRTIPGFSAIRDPPHTGSALC